MPYFIDATDDVLAFDGIRSFTGGQASGIQSDNLAENQYQEAVNMTISPRGRIETRYGFESFSTTATSGNPGEGGLAYYDTYQYEQVLSVSSGRLYSIDNNGVATIQPAETTWSSFSTTWDNTTQTWETGFSSPVASVVNMIQFNDLEYIADGVSPLKYWDGSSVVEQGGKLRSIIVNTGGSNYTSATAIVAGPDLGGATPTLITQIAGGVVTGVVVSDNSEGMYSSVPAVTIIGNGSGATATAVVSAPPTGLRLLTQTGNRVIGVGSNANRNTIYASDILDTSVFAPENSIIVGGDDGQEITAVVPYYANRLIVFKPSKIYQVQIPADMTTAADWIVEQVSSSIGCVAQKSAIQVNSDVLFLAIDGIRSLSRSVSDDFTTVGLPISEVIKDVIQEINQPSVGVSCARFHDNRYILSVPTGASDVCDSIIVYNTILNSFEGTWTYDAAKIIQSNFSSQGVRLMARGNNGIITQYLGYKTLDNTTATDYQDSGSYYESYVTTRDFTFGDIFADKHGSHFEIIFDKTFSNDVDVLIERDTDVDFLAVLSNLNPTTSGLTLPFTLPATLPAATIKRVANDLRTYQKWRTIAIKVYSADKHFALRQVIAAANPDTIEVQRNITSS